MRYDNIVTKSLSSLNASLSLSSVQSKSWQSQCALAGSIGEGVESRHRREFTPRSRGVALQLSANSPMTSVCIGCTGAALRSTRVFLQANKDGWPGGI